jgi:hypothetical protein
VRHRARPTRTPRTALRTLATAGALALTLAACDDDPGATDDTTDEEAITGPEDLEDLEDLEGLDDLDELGDDPFADLEDPNDLVVDGVLSANGVVLPVPDGWRFDEFAFASGYALALAPDSEEQLGAEAVDPATIDQELTFDGVLDANRDTVEADPAVDEEIDIPGAARAVQLRYLDLPSAADAAAGQPETTSVLLIVAERPDGVLAVFSYAAASEDFDDATAELLLTTAAFDPESDPPAAQTVG